MKAGEDHPNRNSAAAWCIDTDEERRRVEPRLIELLDGRLESAFIERQREAPPSWEELAPGLAEDALSRKDLEALVSWTADERARRAILAKLIASRSVGHPPGQRRRTAQAKHLREYANQHVDLALEALQRHCGKTQESKLDFAVEVVVRWLRAYGHRITASEVHQARRKSRI